MKIARSGAVRSKKITDSARGQPCTMRLPGCLDNQSVVFCHINDGTQGTGMKASDLSGFYGCANCHDAYDGRKDYPLGSSVFSKDADALRAMQETHRLMILNGVFHQVFGAKK